MTTIIPAIVKDFDPSTLEKIAYTSVQTIPTREPNDKLRLGYNVWIFLTEKKGTLEQAFKSAGAHILVSETDALNIIKEQLKKAGIDLQ